MAHSREGQQQRFECARQFRKDRRGRLLQTRLVTKASCDVNHAVGHRLKKRKRAYLLFIDAPVRKEPTFWRYAPKL